VSYLVDESDARLADQPLLSNAISFWRRNVAARKPVCFGCREMFSDDVEAGAFLLVTAARAPTSASVSGLCQRAGPICRMTKSRAPQRAR
jgi:hypothetical protein